MPHRDDNYESADDENTRSNNGPNLRATLNAGTICETEDGAYIENPNPLQEPKCPEEHCYYGKYYLSDFSYFHEGLFPKFIFGRQDAMIAVTGNAKIKNVTNGL